MSWKSKPGTLGAVTTKPEARECSVARTLDVVGDKWSLLAVRELMLGTRRFDEIVRIHIEDELGGTFVT